MTSEDRELLREKILLQCHAASRTGAPVSTLLRGCTFAGFPIELPGLERELLHLEDKALIRLVAKTLSPENRRYVTTAVGDDHLALQGLV